MWVLAEYEPTTLFSLRAATATTSGGKSLLVPTPFAVKTALLDAAIRTQGVAAGRNLFPGLRDLAVAVRVPAQIVVNSTFTKILRKNELKNVPPAEKPAAIARARGQQHWPFQKTIAYREYVHYGGSLTFAFSELPEAILIPLLLQVNYLGKRGGFVQLRSLPQVVAELPEDYTHLTHSVSGAFPLGVLQLVDDYGPNITFEQVNIYSSKSMALGRDRVLHHVILPLQMTRSSRSFALYERFEA